MSDPVARLNTALEGRYAIERGAGRGDEAGMNHRVMAFIVGSLLLPSDS